LDQNPEPGNQQNPPETEIPPADERTDNPDPNADPDPKNDPEPVPLKLTAGQFLKRSPQKPGIDGLIRSLYSSKIMSFEEWEKEIETLLKKKIQ
jgi:hypothetical protein